MFGGEAWAYVALPAFGGGAGPSARAPPRGGAAEQSCAALRRAAPAAGLLALLGACCWAAGPAVEACWHGRGWPAAQGAALGAWPAEGLAEDEDEQAVPQGLAPGEVLGWLRSQPFNLRTEEALAGHPLVRAAEAGTMPLRVAQLVLLEEYSIETSDLRSMAVALARHGGSPAAEAFFRSSVDSEAVAREKLLGTARALGLSPAQLAAHEPMPTAHAYTGFLAELSGYSGMGAVAAGFAVNFPAYGRMCGRLGRALVARYNLSEEDVGFFSWFAAVVPGFDDSATAVIAEGMGQNESLAEIRRGVRLLQGYELLFWDSVWARGSGRESMTVAL